jgi:hypothetical protein
MVHLVDLRSAVSLYADMHGARHLLLTAKLAVEKRQGLLLDYCLQPHRFRLLVAGTVPPHALARLFGKNASIAFVGKKDLLGAYRRLAAGLPVDARTYELCGTYEAYHKSECYCLLGKTGKVEGLPPLSEILLSKKGVNPFSAGQKR